MTYLVTDNCVKCKHTTCVAVCPVDCFYEGPDMLVIDPDVCIDCGVCEPECPANAIVPETALSPEEAVRWEEINRRHAAEWPNIIEEKEPPADYEDWDMVPNKYEMFVEKSIPIKVIE